MRRKTILSGIGGLTRTAFGALTMAGRSSKPRVLDVVDLSAFKTGETDINRFDAVETAFRLRNGDIKASEAIEHAITRTETINPHINAIVTKTYDQARETAKTLKGGTFAGLPIFVKDLYDISGVPTGHGSRGYANYVPKKQYPFFDDLFASGVINLGKSSAPEFGMTASTEPLSSGVTRNPWNLNHSTGGSSGGAAALVASGVVPLATASDGGGSIRIPASCCGLFGLKVSVDRFRPDMNERGIPVRIAVNGCVTRTVRDSAMFLAGIERTDGKGGLSPIGLVTRPSKRRLKIGYYTELHTGNPVDQEVVKTTKNAAKLCQSLGHIVEEVESPFGIKGAEEFGVYWAAATHYMIKAWEKEYGRKATSNEFENFTLGLREKYFAEKRNIWRSIRTLWSIRDNFGQSFTDFDLFLSPVVTTPPPEIGFFNADQDFQLVWDRTAAYTGFTQWANVAGAASMSVPLGMSKNGLPIGALFTGNVGDERILLELAYELELAQPWRDQKPSLFYATG